MSARILVIEDHPANLQLMEYLLGAFGHKLTTARTGHGGVEAANQELPDLIVCDIQLPDIDGFEVIDRLKSNHLTRAIPVVAVTAYAMAGDRKRMLEAGFDGYISKPIDPETFVGDIEAFVPAGRAGSLPPATRGKTPARRHNAASGLRVLCVDDSRSNLGVLRAVLEPRGYEVILARSPRQALQLAHEDPPDLVVSDVHMESGGGFELIQQFKEDRAFREIPFVFVSTTVWADQDRERAMALGADDFVLRPVEPDSLVARIETVLARHADGHDRRR